MDTEMIKAIASLWKLALVLLIGVLGFIFRKPVGNLLEKRRLQFKKGDTEVSISQEVEETKTKVGAYSEEKAIAERPAKEVSDEVQKPEPKIPEDWGMEMIKAFSSNNIEGGEEAFKKLQESETDAVQKQKNEAVYFWLRYGCGDTSALRKLKDLATKYPEIFHYTHYWIGECYEKAGDFEKAAEAYEISVQGKETENQRAEVVVSIASCLFRAGKQQEAYDRIMHEIARVTDPSATSTLYEGLASLYETAQDPELRAIALEKAIENRPNDTQLLFRAAYSYSQKEFDSLALLHYKTLLKFNPDDATALNNVGVAYEQLQMPMRSIEFYKKAAKHNETLAAANLAYRYMNAGFAEEASQVLDNAKQQKDTKETHPNVGKAIASISEKEEKESETEESLLNNARKQQRFFLLFGGAYFTKKPDLPNFNGSWQFADGIKVEIIQNEAQIEANWIINNIKYKFEGRLNNRAAKITNYKMRYSLFPGTSSELGFAEESRGYAYFSEDGQQLFIMTLKEKEHSFTTLNKIKIK